MLINRALLSSGIIINSNPSLIQLIQLKEGLGAFEERLSKVHETESSLSVADFQSDNKQQLIDSFNEFKDTLKTICDSIQLDLAEDIVNCKISFNEVTSDTAKHVQGS